MNINIDVIKSQMNLNIARKYDQYNNVEDIVIEKRIIIIVSMLQLLFSLISRNVL